MDNELWVRRIVHFRAEDAAGVDLQAAAGKDDLCGQLLFSVDLQAAVNIQRRAMDIVIQMQNDVFPEEIRPAILEVAGIDLPAGDRNAPKLIHGLDRIVFCVLRNIRGKLCLSRSRERKNAEHGKQERDSQSK